MEKSNLTVGYILLSILIGWLGGWSLYYGVKAVISKKFVLFPVYVFFGVRHFYDDLFFKKGYPTAKGWLGVLIGLILILLGLVLFVDSMYFLGVAGNRVWRDLTGPLQQEGGRFFLVPR